MSAHLGKAKERKRIFVSFAAEDSRYRDFLKGQAKSDRFELDFVDMSVKEPWADSWKTRCRSKIKGCDGTIALITLNTPKANGQLWEVKCSKEEGVRVLGVYVHKEAARRPTTLPKEFDGVRKVSWTDANITNFLDSL